MPEMIKIVGKEWPVMVMIGGVGLCMGSVVVAGVVGVGDLVGGVWRGIKRAGW